MIDSLNSTWSICWGTSLTKSPVGSCQLSILISTLTLSSDSNTIEGQCVWITYSNLDSNLSTWRSLWIRISFEVFFFSGAGHEFSVQIQVGTEAGWLVLTGLASLLRWKMKTHLSQRFLRFVPALFVGWIPASIRPVVVNPVPIIFYDTRNNKLEACSQERNLNSHY